MEAQRRTMMIQAIAMTRERTNWFLAVWSTLVTGLSIAALRGKNVKVGMIPVTILGVITAYQWDLGYGDKANRINDYAKEIGQDPKYWFNEAREKQ